MFFVRLMRLDVTLLQLVTERHRGRTEAHREFVLPVCLGDVLHALKCFSALLLLPVQLRPPPHSSTGIGDGCPLVPTLREQRLHDAVGHVHRANLGTVPA
jgi:hypothetical protein